VGLKLIEMKYVKKHGNWVAERHSSPPPTKRTMDDYRKQEKGHYREIKYTLFVHTGLLKSNMTWEQR
jgi:hypothetical protein